jgi:hypothetical protein
MPLDRKRKIPSHGTIAGACSGQGASPAVESAGDYLAEQLTALANLAPRNMTKRGTTPMTVITMMITGIPARLDGALHMVDAEVTVDFALIAAECLSGPSFGKIKRRATRMGGAIAVKAVKVVKSRI